MKISIVMAYYNRRALLFNTLNSLSFFNAHDTDVEIVIVDDASEIQHSIEDVPDIFTELNIKIISIRQKDKAWINPCVPFNIGFSEAYGDAVIIQNPECLHLHNIVDYVRKNISRNKYLVFGCYALGATKTNMLKDIRYSDRSYIKDVNNVVGLINNARYDKDHSVIDKTERCGWYQHTKFRPDNLHFCTAMTKFDLDDLRGFDERFAKGSGKDDREFLIRIRRKGMEIKPTNSLYTIHQFHNLVSYSNNNKPALRRMKKEKSCKSKRSDHYGQ